MHRLDSGHFAVEDCLEQTAANIQRFYDEMADSPSEDERWQVMETRQDADEIALAVIVGQLHHDSDAEGLMRRT
jgi:hypothetical protein